mgnify:CR=1 FL=1
MELTKDQEKAMDDIFEDIKAYVVFMIENDPRLNKINTGGLPFSIFLRAVTDNIAGRPKENREGLAKIATYVINSSLK